MIPRIAKSLLFLQALSSTRLWSCFAFQVNHRQRLSHINTGTNTSSLRQWTHLQIIRTKTPSSSNTKSSSTSFFPFDNPFSTTTSSTAISIPSSSSSSSTTTSTTTTASTPNESSNEYKRGLAIIGSITLLFSSNSPILHSAFVNSSNPPSVLLLNASTSCIALLGLISFGPFLDSIVPLPSVLQRNQNNQNQNNYYNNYEMKHIQAGIELGFWKTLGTTANLYGLSLTSSNHAAFLIQLTTLIVPSVQGLLGVPVPQRIWTSIGLALSGIYLFTQDLSSSSSSSSTDDVADVIDSSTTSFIGNIGNTMLLGDLLCVVAAVFYATYDLRLFSHGKNVPPLPLIRTKIAVQALLSILMLSILGEKDGLHEVVTYIQDLTSSSAVASSSNDLLLVGSAILWSGLIINAIVPFLQVSGQQTIGASRAQVVYASQPLWASILSFVLLGETLSENGMMGGVLFLSAIFLAASAESPDADCGVENCEV